MKGPLVTVILPTYNRRELLRRALASITEQTYRDIETIVVNDGGEPVLDIVSELPGAIYIDHARNRGLPAARNTSLRYASGQLIAYLDDDDYFYPDHIETLVDTMQSGSEFAYTDAHLIEKYKEPRIYMSSDYDPEALRTVNQFPVCCVMHTRRLVQRSGDFDESLENHEDWDLWLRMAKFTDFVHIPQVTCAVDRSRPTMMDSERHLEGYELVKARYG